MFRDRGKESYEVILVQIKDEWLWDVLIKEVYQHWVCFDGSVTWIVLEKYCSGISIINQVPLKHWHWKELKSTQPCSVLNQGSANFSLKRLTVAPVKPDETIQHAHFYSYDCCLVCQRIQTERKIWLWNTAENQFVTSPCCSNVFSETDFSKTLRALFTQHLCLKDGSY